MRMETGLGIGMAIGHKGITVRPGGTQLSSQLSCTSYMSQAKPLASLDILCPFLH